MGRRLIFIKPSGFPNNYSIEFDGSTEDVRLPNGCFNSFSSGAMSFWIRTRSLAANQAIFTASISGTTNFFTLSINTSGVVFVQCNTGGAIRYLFTCTTTTLSVDTWYQITYSMLPHEITINGVNQTLNFLNGNANSDFYFDNIAAAGTVLYTIGQLRRNTSVNYFNGYIDEPLFFNAAKDSAAREVIWNGGVVFDYSGLSNLVSAYRHGDGAGDVYPTSEDYIGTNDGTMTNMSAANFVNVTP